MQETEKEQILGLIESVWEAVFYLYKTRDHAAKDTMRRIILEAVWAISNSLEEFIKIEELGIEEFLLSLNEASPGHAAAHLEQIETQVDSILSNITDRDDTVHL